MSNIYTALDIALGLSQCHGHGSSLMCEVALRARPVAWHLHLHMFFSSKMQMHVQGPGPMIAIPAKLG